MVANHAQADLASSEETIVANSQLCASPGQNFLNQIAVVNLSQDLSKGPIVDRMTSPHFDIPSTVAAFGNGLYAVNARFSTPPTPDTEYAIVRVPR